tara:strand:+ start:6565 stop:7356 length:792 start_codon:yes stop_codon:yes gene_type:complete
MICLILGDTNFSKIVLHKIIKRKLKYFIIDLSKNNNFKNFKNTNRIGIGQFGKMIKLMKYKQCKKVLFAGKIIKPNFSSFKIDIKGFFYLSKIIKAAKIGDAAVIKLIINILKKEKINVISSVLFNPELSLNKGNYTKIKPNLKDRKDIKIGKNYLNKINGYDYTQGLIVRDGVIIKTENSAGSKKMIQSIKPKLNKEGILIKLPKKKQDLRIDLPTIGLDTIKDCKKAGLKGIVMKDKQNIVLDKKLCIEFANKNKIFINII